MERRKTPTFGTLKLTGDITDRLGAFMGWILDARRLFEFDAIAWERPLLMRTDTVDKLQILYGTVGIARGYAGLHKIPALEVTVQAVKSTVAASPYATKDEMIAAALNDFNWPVLDDHQADAGGVAVWALNQLEAG